MAALLGIMACLTGCFDRRELDTLGIVMGVAMDKAESEGDTELTVQIVNVAGASSEKKGKSGGGGGAGGGGGEAGGTASKPFLNVSATGTNMNYVVHEMQHKMSRRIYMAHSQIIVIGEELAKNGVRDNLDFFARAPEARMTTNVFIAKGKAKDVLNITPEFEKMPSTELLKMLKDQKLTSHTPIVTEFDFVSNIITKTTSAVAPLVSIIEDGGKERLDVKGSAVFKESRMVGELNETETRGMLYVQEKVKTGVFLADIKGETATVEIRRAQCRVTPVLYTDGTAEFNITADVTVGLGDQSGTFNLSNPDNVVLMLNAASAIIKGEIKSAVDKSKELDADVFGFGEYIHRKYPDQWQDMKTKWDELYRSIRANITVNVRADGSGRTVRPLVPTEA
jgi:Ger(x)C family germination protein